MINDYRFVMIEKSKRRDVAIVDVIIPTNLACVLFGAAIQFYCYTCMCKNKEW